jgi:hypothetical protein
LRRPRGVLVVLMAPALAVGLVGSELAGVGVYTRSWRQLELPGKGPGWHGGASAGCVRVNWPHARCIHLDACANPHAVGELLCPTVLCFCVGTHSLLKLQALCCRGMLLFCCVVPCCADRCNVGAASRIPHSHAGKLASRCYADQ